MLFSERLRWLREKKGLSQKDVAEKLGMSQQGYSHLETGRREPKLLTLIHLRHLLGETVDFLIGYHIEDIHAEQLYELYAEARHMREECEEDIIFFDEFYKDKLDSAISLDDYLQKKKEQKDELKDLITKENKILDSYMEYIRKIPGCDGEYATDEFWKNRYMTYKDDEKKRYADFWEDLRNF